MSKLRAKKKNLVMLIIELSSKIYKLILYNKAINDFIYGCQWQKTIEKKL